MSSNSLSIDRIIAKCFLSQADVTESKIADHDTGDNHEDESTPRKSTDNMTQSLVFSTTPVRSGSQRHHKFMSKVASTSLGHHLSSHPSRKTRSSVYSVASRPSSELANIAGPEQFISTSFQDDETVAHARKSSVADSIVGSIRGIGRRTGKTKATAVCTKDNSPEKPADIVPLPSSPIDIPAMAPSLHLDLGPAGFMSTTFDNAPEEDQKARIEEIKKLADPANITTGVPLPTPVLTVDTPPMQIDRRPTRPVTPRDLLKLSIDDLGPNPTPGPATPMPGTSFTLEVDGTNSEKSDKSRVFERSVTPSLDRESRQLRKMRSLDAMAEACTIAHANDELAQMSEVVEENEGDSVIGFSSRPSLRSQTPRRDFGSSGTIQTLHSCPPDMSELTRQRAPDQGRQVGLVLADPASDEEGRSVYEDPFDDRNAIKSGPPWPERSVELPFRPKVHPWSGGETTAGNKEELCSGNGPRSVQRSLSEEKDSLKTTSEADDWYQPDEVAPAEPQENINPFQSVASDDDTHARAQQLLTSDIILPNYDNIDPSATGLSPHGGPLVPQIYHRIGVSQNSSPRSVRSRTTYTAGLTDAEYKFSFDNWLRESSSAAPPDSEPSTPHRRRMDMSLDSVSTSEDRKTPQASPSTNNSKRTPSMGNKLEFELKRSERNTRYNALYQEEPTVLRDAVQQCRRGPPRFIVGASDETEATGIHLPDFGNAQAGSREATPQKALQDRVASQDSVVDSLRNAAYDYYQLEERLADAPGSDDVDVFADSREDVELVGLPTLGFRVTNVSQTWPLQNDSVRLNSLRQDTVSHDEYIFGTGQTAQTTSMKMFPSSPLPTQPLPITELNAPAMSSADSPMTITNTHGKNRVGSSDTLDQSLKLFGSPESGYQADESSVCQENSSVSKARPFRYRSRGRRSAKPLGEISDNTG